MGVVLTSIAYKAGVIAYDSQMTAGSMVEDDSFQKRVRKKGVNFFICGDVTGIDALIDAYFGKEVTEYGSEALVVDDGKLYTCGFEDDVFFKIRQNLKRCTAMGSGTEFLMGSMLSGKSAQEAVKVACRLDIYSGGKIRVFTIK